MAGVKQMVGGFNHNVKHRGKAYHVQTEDSGVQNPHIVTHLFVGGNVLASKKTSYADVLQAENLAQVVRELMEEQHKEMLRNLVNGVYDDRDEARSYQPGQLAVDGAASSPPAPVPARITAPPSAKPPPLAAAPRPAEPARPAARAVSVPSRPAAPPATVAAPATAPRVVFRPALTPPPVLSRTAPAAAAPPPAKAGPPSAAPGVPALTPASRPASPAPSPPPPLRAVAGDDLASDKSLDQVILSYLAEEEPRTRK